MAILGQTASGRIFYEFRMMRSTLRGLLALSAMSFALTMAGCSSPSTRDISVSTERRSQERSNQDKSIQDKSSSYRAVSAHPQAHRLSRALVARQSAPDCEFAGPESDTVDADVWARLKLDYERHCYKQAEMLARKRLQQLLALGKCRIEPN